MKKLLLAGAMVLSTFAVFGEVAETRYSSDGGETWTEGTLTEAVTAANENADTIIELNRDINFPATASDESSENNKQIFKTADQQVILRSNRSVNPDACYTITRQAAVGGSQYANIQLRGGNSSLTIENVKFNLGGYKGNVFATRDAGQAVTITLGEGVEVYNCSAMGNTSLIQLIVDSSLVIDGAVIHDVTGANMIIYGSKKMNLTIKNGGVKECSSTDANAMINFNGGGSFTMTGGYIKNNTAKTTGAVNLKCAASFSGNPVIQNNKIGTNEKNLYVATGGSIVQSGNLTEGAYIGVSNKGTTSGATFGSLATAGLTGAEHFHCDGKSFAGFADGTTLKWATYTDVTVVFSGTLTMADWVVDETPSEPSGLTVNYGTLVYKYYSDAACTQPLDEKPSEIGVYYVRGEVAEGADADRNRWAAAASDAVSFMIKSGDKEVVQTTVEGTLVIEDWYRDATPNKPTGLTLTSGHGTLVYKYYAESACETELAVVPNVIGTYYVRGEVAAGEDDHYIWSEWKSDSVAFRVLQPWYVITEPTVNTGLIYNGEEQTGVGPASEYYTLDDAAKTAAGEYTAIATLKTEGQEHELEWLDGTKTPKEFPWSIAKVKVALTGKVTIQDWMQGDTPAPSGVTASFGEVQYRYYLDAGCTQAVGVVPTEIGTYFVRAEVDSDGNVDGAVSPAVKVQIVKKYDAADKPEGATFFARLANDERLVTGAAAEKLATGADMVLKVSNREQIFVFTNAAEAATFKTKRRGVADILVIAGGGAGGYNAGAGGGAGGAVYMTDVPLNGEYAITVGKGGTTATSSEAHSTNGENSSISNATEAVAVVDVAVGGGAGGGYSSSTKADVKTAICTGYDGGSGGGGYKNYAGGVGTAGQGNAGYGFDNAIQGGGGGAGEAATSNNGGAGRTFYLLGYAETFAGGGGAGCDKSTSQTIGGLGGGGAGGYWNKNNEVTAISGEDGLGAGGGGGGGGTNATDANKLAGKGGDGIVIIRYTAEPMGLMLLLQ